MLLPLLTVLDELHFQGKIDVARCGMCTLKLVRSQCFCLQLTPRPLLLSRTFILCSFLSPISSRWQMLPRPAMTSVRVDAVCHERLTARLSCRFNLNHAKTSVHNVYAGCRAHSRDTEPQRNCSCYFLPDL